MAQSQDSSSQREKQIDYEAVFHGTPAEFGVAAQIWEHRLLSAGTDAPILTTFDPLPADANPVDIHLRIEDTWNGRRRVYFIGSGVTAQRGPNGTSLLIIWGRESIWTHALASWRALRDALRQQGWTIEECALRNARGDDAPTQLRQPRPHMQRKLVALRDLREEGKRRRHIPGWITACDQVGIDPKTAKKYDPELRKHWDDWEY